ncbi:GTP-binding protein [Campylobacter sp. MIT 99-7217]|uniref:lysophospholipid acyltransferase family protein n=1 Tax=Campylobacter sp. MIT 99-7217 TaxID=535091 RepID=UPI001157F10E|nr:lysophospholipid acyltransferase family protein [Campylobacter sp. MIT 99-7217]TQR29362.1 GTP-binding protein [Campylobacter sp. MIT 99-7217]
MEKWFKFSFVPFVIFLLQWLIFMTCRKKFIGEKTTNTPCVLLFWHGRLAFMPFIFRYMGYKALGKKAFVMISHHKDGEIIAKNIEFFNINTIRGSTYKGASAVIKEAFKVLDKNDDVVITPDGPRGPWHSVSDGSVMIAQKKGVGIMLLNYEASRYWEFKTWDKMILPKPFSTIVYRISPLSVKNLEKNEAKEMIKQKLEAIAQMDGFERFEKCSSSL